MGRSLPGTPTSPDGKDAHVRKVFQAELQHVGEELIHIATLVQEALGRASEAFLQADIQEAEEVITNDARIDFMQNELDERAIDILALQGPVASDLRMIVGALRMSSSPGAHGRPCPPRRPGCPHALPRARPARVHRAGLPRNHRA